MRTGLVAAMATKVLRKAKARPVHRFHLRSGIFCTGGQLLPAFERLPFGVHAVVFLFAHPLSFHSAAGWKRPTTGRAKSPTATLTGSTYEVTITTYTKASVVADREFLQIRWGDEGSEGITDSLPRINGPLNPAGVPTGELLDGDIRLNLYRGTHTYAGPGVYSLIVEDPNRNAGV